MVLNFGCMQMVNRISIAGFSVVSGNRWGPLSFRTGGFRCKYLYSSLILGRDEFTLAGRFLCFRYTETFPWKDIADVQSKRTFPAGFRVEIALQGGGRIHLFCLTSRQREYLVDELRGIAGMMSEASNTNQVGIESNQ